MQPYASYTEKSNPLYDTVTKVETFPVSQGEVNGTDCLTLSTIGVQNQEKEVKRHHCFAFFKILQWKDYLEISSSKVLRKHKCSNGVTFKFYHWKFGIFAATCLFQEELCAIQYDEN